MIQVDILYCAWNRLEFTTATWAWMKAHTNWDAVANLIVYDDGSEDGTLEFLRDACSENLRYHGRSIHIDLRVSDLRSPPAIMNHYLATSEAEWFCKIDNDIALPGGWLDSLTALHEREPLYRLIGMEAGMNGHARGKHYVEPSSHVGGVGLFHVASCRGFGKIPERGRFGWTEWQIRHDLPRGWIAPDLNVPQLDKIPFDPWLTYRRQYIEQGWSREWDLYDANGMKSYFDWVLA